MKNPKDILLKEHDVAKWNKLREDKNFVVPDFTEANFAGTMLPNVNLSDADLRRADFTGADLKFADFTGADLKDATLSGANLSEANLSYAKFSRLSSLSHATLSSAKFVGANLEGAYLFKAKLLGADLSSANLTGAVFRDALLFSANFSFADLTYANLNDAMLINAGLRKAKFSQTLLKGTDFRDCGFGGTALLDVDLSETINLEKAKHEFPSFISIDTLYLSKGKIPEAFLRGCGVPEDFITYLPSLLGAQQIIQFYSCFISYSTHDEEFAKRLHSRMQQENLRVWFAPEDMEGGKKIVDQIDSAIRMHDKLLLVLSESSMKSKWVVNEIRRARKAEQKEGRQKLFPIRLVGFKKIEEWEQMDSTGEDIVEEIRQYYIPDFTHWEEHKFFEDAFAKLLKALQAEEAK